MIVLQQRAGADGEGMAVSVEYQGPDPELNQMTVAVGYLVPAPESNQMTVAVGYLVLAPESNLMTVAVGYLVPAPESNSIAALLWKSVLDHRWQKTSASVLEQEIAGIFCEKVWEEMCDRYPLESYPYSQCQQRCPYCGAE
jgi:hypothetical protein